MSRVRSARDRFMMAIERHPVWLSFATAIVVTLPAIVAVGSNLFRHWYPTGDVSHTELMLRGIPRHPPLVGVAARVGNDINNQGYTPGPSMAYVMYPVYLVFGRTSLGVLMSTLSVHFAAIWASLHTIRRWAGDRTMLVLAIVIALMVRALAPRFFLEPWNVWIPVFAFLLFLVLAWGVVNGHTRALPIMCIVGTHCVQTHISYVPLVVALTIGVAAHALIKGARESKRQLGWSIALMILMWIPPVIEQLRPGSGNLRRLWEHFTDPPSDTVGLAAAIKAMAGELNLLGPWLRGPGRAPYDSPQWFGFALFVALVVAGIVAARGQQRLRRAQIGLGGTTIIGLIATARIFGNFYDYLIRWMWVLAVLWVAVSVAAIIGRSGVARVRRTVGAVGMALLVAVTTWGSVASARAYPPYRHDSDLVAGLAPQLDDALPVNHSARLLRWHDPAALGGTAFGLVLEMEKRGVELGVDPWGGAAARPYRVLTEDRADSVLWLVVGPENIERFAARADAIQIAYFDSRSPAEKAESDGLRVKIESSMRAAGHPEWIELLDSQYGHMQILLFSPVSLDLFDLVARYSEIRLPAAVFAVPPGAPLYP
ncbi:MAG: hypothetical protein ACKOJC_00790 [Actinomycetota bacterium]